MTLRSWLPRLGTSAALVTAATVLLVDQPASTEQGGAAPNAAEAASTVGMLDPEDPGPFPDSVVPEDDTWVVAGERDGTSEFPVLEYPQVQPVEPGVMDFEHFHTGIEINWWLKKWAYEHPDIVTL
jgi:hypothetical protein